MQKYIHNPLSEYYTAIPYRASTGPEQGFPFVVFPHREKPVFITGFPGDKNRFFPVRNTTQGKPQGWICSVAHVAQVFADARFDD